jgi:hypothetical protein
MPESRCGNAGGLRFLQFAKGRTSLCELESCGIPHTPPFQLPIECNGGVAIRIRPPQDNRYREWCAREGRRRYISGAWRCTKPHGSASSNSCPPGEALRSAPTSRSGSGHSNRPFNGHLRRAFVFAARAALCGVTRTQLTTFNPVHTKGAPGLVMRPGKPGSSIHYKPWCHLWRQGHRGGGGMASISSLRNQPCPESR